MKLISFPSLKAEKGIGYSRVHLARLIEAGKFPAPLRLGAGGRIAWLESEVDDWIRDRMAEREVA